MHETVDAILAKVEYDKNRAKIQEFLIGESRTLADKSRIEYAYHLCAFSNWLKRPFRNATAEDLNRYFNEILPASKLSTNYINTRLIIVRKFYRWVYGITDRKTFPPVVRALRQGRVRSVIPADRLPTPEEIAKLLQACRNARDQAILALIYDSGIRVGECAVLKVGNVVFDEHGIQIYVPEGKTGSRGPIRLIYAESYIRNWWSFHAHVQDPEASLFGLTLNGIQNMTYATSKRAGVRGLKPGKRFLTPHDLRHVAATREASWMTEAQMRIKFGWSPTSTMPGRYVHLSGRDIDRATLQRYGKLLPAEIPAASTAFDPRVVELLQALLRMAEKGGDSGNSRVRV